MLGLLVMGVSGCGFMTWARVSLNEPINAEAVAFIVPGQTTFEQVRRRLGAPSDLAGLKDGALASYFFRDAKYFRVNLGWPSRFFIPENPDFVLAGGGLGADVFLVAFDDRWVVRQYAFSKRQQSTRFRAWPFDPWGRAAPRQPPAP